MQTYNMPSAQPHSHYVCPSEGMHARQYEGSNSYEQSLVAARSGSACTGDALVSADPDIEGLAPAPRRRVLDRDVVDGGFQAERASLDAKATSLVAADSEVSYSRCIPNSASTRFRGKR